MKWLVALIILALGTTALLISLSQKESGVALATVGGTPLMPGGLVAFACGGSDIELSVPNSESASIGTFIVRTDRSSEPFSVERDGTVESVTVGRFGSDASDGFVVVVRNAGSSSAATLWLVSRTKGKFSAAKIPEPPASLLDGYMGHDEVTIHATQIVRTFPVYSSSSGVRVDQNYDADKFKSGESPFVTGADTNASPSAGKRTLRYDFENELWTIG